MIKTLSRTQDTILVVDDTGNVKTARADHPKWKELTELLSRITYIPDCGQFSGPVDELLSTMDLKTAIETYTVGLLSVSALGVTYAARPLHTIDVDRLLAFMREKQDYRPIANYIARKMKNPSARAIKEMYAFLEHKGMPLTLTGTFIAYKGVGPDDWSITGNKDTVVLQGEVNEQGRIKNTIGATIEVERSSVDDDFRNGCSTGLHVGSLEYARRWGKKVVYVEVDPADVVSVPSDCNCQKLRCCKYIIVGECTGLLPNTYTNEFNDPNEPDVCHQCGATGDCDCQGDIDDEVCDECGEHMDACVCESEAETATMAAAPVPLVSSPEPLYGGYTAEERGLGKCVEPCNCGHCQHEREAKTVGFKLDEPFTSKPLNMNFDPQRLAATRANLNPIFYTRVVNLMAEQLGVKVENIRPDQTPFDLGADSLDGVELVMAIEEEFGIEVSDNDAEKHDHSTIGQIVKDMEERLGIQYPTIVIPPNVPAIAPENAAAYDTGVCDGKKHRAVDRGMNLFNPKYLPDDVNGSDSPAHADYIRGYVFGYAQ